MSVIQRIAYEDIEQFGTVTRLFPPADIVTTQAGLDGVSESEEHEVGKDDQEDPKQNGHHDGSVVHVALGTELSHCGLSVLTSDNVNRNRSYACRRVISAGDGRPVRHCTCRDFQVRSELAEIITTTGPRVVCKENIEEILIIDQLQDRKGGQKVPVQS